MFERRPSALNQQMTYSFYKCSRLEGQNDKFTDVNYLTIGKKLDTFKDNREECFVIKTL
ncbi:MAG: hypothetical protein HQL06_02255 [Nitrospirae bacterium]|nr:hypothetical protein [Nitrospirota bacterium]